MNEKQLKIAIVGNSPILLKQNYGEDIDNHDIVIRFNKFETKGFEIHTGTKTTDVCFCAYLRNDEILNFPKEHRYFVYGNESIQNVAQILNDTYNGKISLDDCIIVDHDKYFNQLITKLNPKRNIGGTGGLIMCQMMVDMYPNAQIDVYGITFGTDGIKLGNDTISPHYTRNGIYYEATYHDEEAEWKYYKKYLKDKINLYYENPNDNDISLTMYINKN